MIDTIINNFEVWTDAQGVKSKLRIKGVENISLEGIARLRELILELAITGRLIKSDTKDDSVVKLIERIKAKKIQLINDGKVKKEKILEDVRDDEKGSLIPENWKWLRFQDVTEYIQRGKGPNYADKGQVKVISQKCIRWEGLDLSPSRFVEDKSLDKYKTERYLQEKDILWNSTGNGTVGRACLIENCKSVELVADSHVTVIRPILIDSSFLKCFIQSPLVQKRIEPGVKNSLVSGSTNQVELNTSSVKSLAVPIAPIEEQKRIVAKVDELMALCDQLEEDQTSNLKTHKLLVKALLKTLIQAKDSKELQMAWVRLESHFDTLFYTEDSIEQFKEMILKLAVMGKLVIQDPKDEPASELLNIIGKEKSKLIKEGKIKKQKPLPELTEKELPYVLPDGWAWCRLDNLTEKLGAGSTPSGGKSAYVQNGIMFFRSQNVYNDGIRTNDIAQISNETHAKMAGTQVKPQDILLNITGGSIGRSALIDDDFDTGNVSQHVAIVRMIELDTSKYIHQFIISPWFQDKIMDVQVGVSREGLSMTKLKLFPTPLPPLKEQQRIITKIKELNVICDALTKRIKKSQEIKGLLSKAIMGKSVL